MYLSPPLETWLIDSKTMNKRVLTYFLPLLALGMLVFVGFAPMPQNTTKVILVDLNVQNPTEAGKCYTPQYDVKQIELEVDIDDTLYSLPDFAYIEDPLEGPECFYPEMKLIFREYTYVVSMWCTSVIKYKNTAPYKPSPRTVRNDLKLTSTSLDYLRYVRRKHFGKDLNGALAENFFKAPPLEEDDPDQVSIDEDDEDEEDDKELEKDAVGNEGWFDDADSSEDDLEVKDDDLDDDGK